MRQTGSSRPNGGPFPPVALPMEWTIEVDTAWGGKAETPVIIGQSILDDPGLIQYAINRYMGFREHQPFSRWVAFSDSADSAYESYVAGNPSIRNPGDRDQSNFSWLRNGPYFASDPHNWPTDFHVGGKKVGAAPEINHPQLLFTRG